MIMTTDSPGTALRALLAGWALDDQACSEAQGDWLLAGLSEPLWIPTLREYQALAPILRAWLLRRGLPETTITRAMENAYDACSCTQ